jgi:putative ABC transport system permease protein
MGVLTLCAVALSTLRRNLFRSLLTTAGIAVGVGAVITVVALGAGARTAIEEDVKEAGTNLVMVLAGNRTSAGVRMGMGSSSRLTSDDAEHIRSLPDVAYVAPGLRTRRQLIVAGQNWAASVEGTGVDLPFIRSWPLAAGRFFTRRDVAAAAKLCVIGSIVRDVLFGPAVNPVGRIIRIGAQPFVVIGVLTSKGQSATGEDQDDIVFVPYTTAQKKLMGVTYLRSISVSTVSADTVGEVAERIRVLLRVRHQILPGEPNDFRVRTLEDIVSIRTSTTETMTTLLGGVAAVSLLVGGIGVMNIMLVSVTERTREIGLRVAVGARTRDVLIQFLAEAAIISLGGGVAGIALGGLLSAGLTHLFSWPTNLSAESVAISFGFAAMVGLFFGWYPAYRAAAIDPINALRFE